MKLTREEEEQVKNMRVPPELISVNLTVNVPCEITYATDSEQALLARIDELEKANEKMKKELMGLVDFLETKGYIVNVEIE